MRERDRVIRVDADYPQALDRFETNPDTGVRSQTAHWVATRPGHYHVFDHTEDVVTENYRERIAQGEIISNPFLSHKTEIYGPDPTTVEIIRRDNYPVVVQYRPYPYTVEYTGLQIYLGPTPYTMSTKPSECDSLRETVKSLAVTNAHANVNEAEMQALATIAESRKTVDSLYEIIRKALKVFRAVRRLDLRRLKKELKPSEIEDLYMSFRYALRPLMYDAIQLTAALQVERASKVRQTSRGWAKDSASGQYDHGEQSLVDGTACTYTMDWTYDVSARAGVLCDMTIDATTAFGVTDLIETGWELLPFSFIADWFANIGTTIAAWTPNMRAEQLTSWVTVKETFQCSVTAGSVTDYYSPGQYMLLNTANVVPGEYSGKEVLLQREIDPQLSVFPSVNIRLDTLKILDLVIVLRSLMGLR